MEQEVDDAPPSDPMLLDLEMHDERCDNEETFFDSMQGAIFFWLSLSLSLSLLTWNVRSGKRLWGTLHFFLSVLI